MKWVAVIGTREVDDEIRADMEREVGVVTHRGDGITSGGATGADHEAARIAYRAHLGKDRLRLYLPAALDIYASSLHLRARAGKCRPADARQTIALLRKLAVQPGVIIDDTPYSSVDAESFHFRNRRIIDCADELIAFRVNMSAGTTYTIDQARAKGIPVQVFDYER